MTARRVGVLLGLAAVLLLAACTRSSDTPPVPAAASAVPAAGDVLATPAPLQGDDLVDLTVYFRAGQGVSAHLEPVVREVAVTDDLPRRALELLLEGPTEEDGTLEPPLPTTTRVLGLVVEGGTAHVDLSAAVVRDASAVGATSANEVLAMGALANTLTEFTSVERVVLSVDGKPISELWGGWGVPEVLVRDESLVESATEREGVADLSRFSSDTQELGSASAPPVRVTSVRVRDRLTHVRFVLEIADVDAADAAAKIPLVKVRRANDDIALLLSGVVDMGIDDTETRLDVDAAQFTAARVELDELAGTLRVTLTPTEPRPYWLHTLANPTRVVLDVKK